jgi:hypothetical protein
MLPPDADRHEQQTEDHHRRDRNEQQQADVRVLEVAPELEGEQDKEHDRPGGGDGRPEQADRVSSRRRQINAHTVSPHGGLAAPQQHALCHSNRVERSRFCLPFLNVPVNRATTARDSPPLTWRSRAASYFTSPTS